MDPGDSDELPSLPPTGYGALTRYLVPALVLSCATIVAASAQAKPSTKRIAVKVVDQAGSIVFIKPGESAGIRPGQTVRLRKRTYRVIAVTAKTATIEVGKRVLRIGARGRTRVNRRRTAAEVRAKPTPLDTFRGQWAHPVVPADTQTPTPIPIGHIRRSGAHEIVIRAGSNSLFPIRGGDRVTRVSVRAQLRSEPFSEVPFGVDADVEIGRWIGRGLTVDLGAGSRPIVEVQELRLRYGDRDDPGIGLGRLRYAARSVGLLDGVRTSSPRFHGVSVFAFGGLVPNTLDGKPDTDLARFGVGASYLDGDSPWRPSAEITAYGSVFDREMDERRLTAHGRIYPGAASFGARVELSGFDQGNPWGANRLELTSGGVDASIGHKRWRASASIDALQPERSKWLASLLPATWLCTAEVSAPGASPESCNGERNTRYIGLLTTGFDHDRFAVRVGGNAIANQDMEIEQNGGFVDIHLPGLWRKLSIEVGTMASRTEFLDAYAVRMAMSSPVLDGLDASVFYRPARLIYEAATQDLIEHRIGAEAFYAPRPEWGVRVSTEAASGNDVSIIGVFATAVWRTSL